MKFEIYKIMFGRRNAAKPQIMLIKTNDIEALKKDFFMKKPDYVLEIIETVNPERITHNYFDALEHHGKPTKYWLDGKEISYRTRPYVFKEEI